MEDVANTCHHQTTAWIKEAQNPVQSKIESKIAKTKNGRRKPLVADVYFKNWLSASSEKQSTTGVNGVINNKLY